ncbi:MAG: hypothetical protein OES47_02990 [Acidobacteriota bacterium]|nr:hypothetical protein [Acidobacteriota bacterium]
MTTQLIPVGTQLVPLPEGVSATDWGLERVRWQNPRIRALLLANQLLEGILDSNYAILHCSPRRLEEILRRVREVSEVLRLDFAPLLQHPSLIPTLETAIDRARLAFGLIDRTILKEFERLADQPTSEDLSKLRKLLCVSIGKVHAYIQDAFCEIIAADPRSVHAADYFLSRRFPRDIEEAEWLHASVSQLETYLHEIGAQTLSQLTNFKNQLAQNAGIPDEKAWEATDEVLEELRGRLTTLLKETLALRGIRFDEMEALDRYSSEIPAKCQTLLELHSSSLEIAGRLFQDAQSGLRPVHECVNQLFSSHEVLARRIGTLVGHLIASILDLQAFVPLWMKSIERRRALLLIRGIEQIAD